MCTYLRELCTSKEEFQTLSCNFQDNKNILNMGEDTRNLNIYILYIEEKYLDTIDA